MFQSRKHLQGLRGTLAAHLTAWPEAGTDGRPARTAKEQATVVRRQLDATLSSRLAVWHSGDRWRDGGGDAAGGATNPAVKRFHCYSHVPVECIMYSTYIAAQSIVAIHGWLQKWPAGMLGGCSHVWSGKSSNSH